MLPLLILGFLIYESTRQQATAKTDRGIQAAIGRGIERRTLVFDTKAAASMERLSHPEWNHGAHKRR